MQVASSSDSQLSDGQAGVASLQVITGGTYYIKVTEPSTAVGNYDLAVYNAWSNPGVTDVQRQYHGTFNTAYYIEDGNYQATGLLPHYYRFTVQPNSQVDVNLTARLNYGYLNFTLHDASGVQIASSSDSQISNGQTGLASRLLVEGGLYYLKVTEPSTAIGSYDLVITGADLYPSYYGDVNGNGIVDLSDVITVLQLLGGSDPIPLVVGADINKDGVLSLPEAIFILRQVAETVSL